MSRSNRALKKKNVAVAIALVLMGCLFYGITVSRLGGF